MSESFSTRPPAGIHGSQRALLFCPRCNSPKIRSKNHGKKLCSALGTCAGVMRSLSGIAKGATAGAAFGFRAVGPSTPMNNLTASVLGALVGGAMGCATGAAFGQVIDETMLNNLLCLGCGHSFPTP